MTPRSLRADLTRASLVTTLVAVLLSAGSLVLYELGTYRSALVADLRTQADLLAHSSAAALVFNDPNVGRENLGLLKVKPSVRAGAIYDRNGRAFATYGAGPDEQPPGRLDPGLGPLAERFDGSRLEVTYGIEDAGERIGTVYLMARHDMGSRAIGYGAILAGVTLLSLILSYFVFGRLQRNVTGPLLQVSGVAQQVIARRDWSLRAPGSPNADVAVLVDAFNGMLAEVESSTRQLERSNAKLAQINAELARANERLEQETAERRVAEESLRVADRRKDEFLAMLAHELRNPLAPMTNAIALIRAPAASPSVRAEAAGIIERQLRQMVRLIDDLLDMSRITTGKLLLRKEVVDLADVLRGALEVAQPAVDARDQQLGVEIECSPCWIDGDAARLAQVFSNLLSNACRYTGPGGRITVRMTRDAAAASVEVCDTGAGIAPEMQQRIFELFEQVDKSLERGNAGLGIGLTLARQLAQLHGGDISVRSAGLGFGACFTVRLPLLPQLSMAAVAAAATSPAGTAPALARAPRPLRVLVADDNRDYAESLAVLLRMQGHDVVVVHEGAEALAAASRNAAEVALLDIGMPGLNGYEVARRLRADRRTSAMRLIAITGWGQAADRALAVEAGFDHHLVKPVSIDELNRVLAPEPACR